MARITIDLEQGRSRLMRCESRLLQFPDAIGRIITLQSRYWLMYDRLSEKWVYPGLYEDECFDMAFDYGIPGEPAFEQAIARFYRMAIDAGLVLLNEEMWANANQNA